VDESHYLRVHIAHIRAKIERDASRPRYLITEAGVGYRLRDPEQDAGPTDHAAAAISQGDG
jgi:two-component system KDP operon response regulator KdpE